MEYNPNTKTMESSKKNGLKKHNDLSFLENYGFELKSNCKRYNDDDEFVPFYQHKIKDLCFLFDYDNIGKPFSLYVDNHYDRNGNWSSNYHSSVLKYWRKLNEKVIIEFIKSM
jgi:hypothetical protein